MRAAMTDVERVREEAWKEYRKARRGYLHDKHSFEAGYSAGRAAREAEIEQLRSMYRAKDVVAGALTSPAEREKRLREAAKTVIWFEAMITDSDAIEAIAELRRVLEEGK